jgi:assimilatory nitrate reductase catalytic subunit
MTAPAKVVPTIRPDTVFVPFHWVGANRLTNDALDPASRMPEFKVCAASVSPPLVEQRAPASMSKPRSSA